MKKYSFILIVLTSFLGMQLFSQVNYYNTAVDSSHYSSAIGYSTTATGVASFASGWNSNAEGDGAFAFGHSCYSNSTNTIALGKAAQAYRPNSIAIGDHVITGMTSSPFNGSNAICIGNQSIANGDYSMAFGQNVKAGSTNSFVIGKGYSETEKLVNANPNSLSIGFNSTKPTLFISSSSGGPTETGKVGIGLEYPMEKLDVNGNILVSDPNSGLILKSPDGNTWKLTVNNYGELEIVDPGKVNENPNINKNNFYPNPAENSVHFSINEKDIQFPVTVEIFDIKGTLVYKAPFMNADIKINISSFSKGTYVINMKDSNQELVKTEKLIKK